LALQHHAADLAMALALGALLAAGCHPRPIGGMPPVAMRSQPPPSADERYCAWYGSARDGVLYFGEAAFWSAYRLAGQDPRADLRRPGPQPIGRFDLERLAFLEPLNVTAEGARSGVWDVFAHRNGRVYYTTFFEEAGFVDLASREGVRFAAGGLGLNELAPGPDGGILVSRYGGPGDGDGSLVLLDADGGILAEHPLEPVADRVVAPKTVAWDPVRDEFWVNTDLVPRGPGEVRYDARVLDRAGRERARLSESELQFVAFREDGVGIVAEVDAAGLWLRVLRPDDEEGAAERGERFLVDEFFDRRVDFAQDIQFAPDGRAVVTRWSGRFHVVDPELPLSRTLSLPRPEDGLFYTGVLHGDRVCATLCGAISVVCAPAAPF
jgi:hypothetical protein